MAHRPPGTRGRFGTTTLDTRKLLIPLSAAFALGGIAMALSAGGGAITATPFLAAAATAFTLTEMLHATVSWGLSAALAPDTAQGAFLGVHGLAQSAQGASDHSPSPQPSPPVRPAGLPSARSPL